MVWGTKQIGLANGHVQPKHDRLNMAVGQKTTVDISSFITAGTTELNNFQLLTMGFASNITDNTGAGAVTIDNFVLSASGGSVDVLLGDVDLSGVVDFGDIPAFVAVLQGGLFQAEADIDMNMLVDFSDIPLFIDILAGG